MKKLISLILALSLCLSVNATVADEAEKKTIRAIYIPLADHYAGIIAYEKYRDQMVYADYQIERMKSWPLLRAYFLSGEVDMAYVISPMAMDMFYQSPNFRWVGLMHRDGNALAINELLNQEVQLPKDRQQRKPDEKVANAMGSAKQILGRPIEVGVPHLQSTHTVILYKYLKDFGKSLALGHGSSEDAVAIEVPPPKSPVYIKKKNKRGLPAAFEQSLPWADVVETGNFGYVAWYSKDVLPWPNGHVECIAIAQDKTIKQKNQALKEVMHYIRKAGEDIEQARLTGDQALEEIASMVRKHIPEHNQEAIKQSLRLDLNVINYKNLDIDKDGLRKVMDLAVEGNIIKQIIDIDLFADGQFGSGQFQP